MEQLKILFINYYDRNTFGIHTVNYHDIKFGSRS